MAETATKKTPAEFVANYSVAVDNGLCGPFTVGHITLMTTRNSVPLPPELHRYIYNVNAVSSTNENKGLSYSHPASWGKQFATGEMVNLLMTDAQLDKLIKVPVAAPRKRGTIATVAEVNEVIEALQERKQAQTTQELTATFEGETSLKTPGKIGGEDAPF